MINNFDTNSIYCSQHNFHVLYGSHNIQRIFHYLTLTGWFFKAETGCVSCPVRAENLNSCLWFFKRLKDRNTHSRDKSTACIISAIIWIWLEQRPCLRYIPACSVFQVTGVRLTRGGGGLYKTNWLIEHVSYMFIFLSFLVWSLVFNYIYFSQHNNK